MSYAAEWQIIRDRFRTQWSATPIAWFDQPFTAPENGDPYVRISVATDEAQQASYGSTNPLYRSAGVVAVQVFVPSTMGDDTLASTYLDPLCAIWRGYTSGGVRFGEDRAPFARRIGRTDRGYIEWQVIAPYRRDTIF